MTSAKSLYSWDVVIKKYQDKLFIDKRDEPNMLDLLTVNETSQEQPIDDDSINGVRQLMQEATNVNHSLLAQACNPDLFDKQDEADPFIEVEGQVAVRLGYKYKIWVIGKKRICIRSSIHTYIPNDNIYAQEAAEGEKPVRSYQNVYALTEFEGNNSNWKKNLDTKTAECLTKDVQDNSCKISRWVVQSILADVDQIKFAFVTRKTPSDNTKHVILGTYLLNTNAFAK